MDDEVRMVREELNESLTDCAYERPRVSLGASLQDEPQVHTCSTEDANPYL